MWIEKLNKFLCMGIVGIMGISTANAAITLDRTRIVYPGGEKSVSMVLHNKNEQAPYLAQAWIEDEQGQKLDGKEAAFTVLPPLQRIEPGAESQVKIQALPKALELPQDRETVYYFNVREIPPKSDKANVLQIALQTRIKMFYRPAVLAEAAAKLQAIPYQEQLTLSKKEGTYVVNNPTPYYVTLLGASDKKGGESVQGFEPLMLAPKSSAPLGVAEKYFSHAPYLMYVNDYGGQVTLTFGCEGSDCKVVPEKK